MSSLSFTRTPSLPAPVASVSRAAATIRLPRKPSPLPQPSGTCYDARKRRDQRIEAHGADQVAKIAASMAEFGWIVPCLVAPDGELIAGHSRVLAATQLGLTEAPLIVLGHLTEAQRRACRIADNKLTELGSWDDALLSAELQDLLAEDFDLSLVGFSDGNWTICLAWIRTGTVKKVAPGTPCRR